MALVVRRVVDEHVSGADRAGKRGNSRPQSVDVANIRLSEPRARRLAAKLRGKRLGRPKGYQIPSNLETRARGSAANAANAVAFAARLRPVFTELASLSANAAAAELDRGGVQTALGGKWTARAVINIRQRLEG